MSPVKQKGAPYIHTVRQPKGSSPRVRFVVAFNVDIRTLKISKRKFITRMVAEIMETYPISGVAATELQYVMLKKKR